MKKERHVRGSSTPATSLISFIFSFIFLTNTRKYNMNLFNNNNNLINNNNNRDFEKRE